MIVSNLQRNAEMAKRLIAEAVGRIPAERGCPCGSALSNAIITSPGAIPAELKRELAPLVGKYVK
jgi:5'-methylthioadenosine phosphorylase